MVVGLMNLGKKRRSFEGSKAAIQSAIADIVIYTLIFLSFSIMINAMLLK